MGDGGHHRACCRMRADKRARLSAPDDQTTRYLLPLEFPFNTAELLFDVTADEDGAADTAGIFAAPETKRPLEDEDILTEILCRLPPLPSPLARACLVSRLWASLGASAAFRRRLHAHHQKPPVVGLYGKHGRNLVFIPALEAPDRVPPERFSLMACADQAMDYWDVLGCRQGRVLVVNRTRRELHVFDPVSGDLRLLAFPPDFVDKAGAVNGAVVVDDLQDQSPSPFKVVLVGVSANNRVAGAVAARVYSSKTGAWGDLVSTPEPAHPGRVGRAPSTMVSNGLYWWLAEPVLGAILHFDLSSQRLTVIERPPVADINIRCSRIIRSEDGGVGLAVLSYTTFCVYDRKVDADGVTTWPVRKTVAMTKILDLLELPVLACIVGYTEEADAIVMMMRYGWHKCLYIIQLNSMQYKKVEEKFSEIAYYPLASFYTGGPSMLQLPALVDS